jgi:hypothetical protein
MPIRRGKIYFVNLNPVLVTRLVKKVSCGENDGIHRAVFAGRAG